MKNLIAINIKDQQSAEQAMGMLHTLQNAVIAVTNSTLATAHIILIASSDCVQKMQKFSRLGIENGSSIVDAHTLIVNDGYAFRFNAAMQFALEKGYTGMFLIDGERCLIKDNTIFDDYVNISKKSKSPFMTCGYLSNHPWIFNLPNPRVKLVDNNKKEVLTITSLPDEAFIYIDLQQTTLQMDTTIKYFYIRQYLYMLKDTETFNKFLGFYINPSHAYDRIVINPKSTQRELDENTLQEMRDEKDSLDKSSLWQMSSTIDPVLFFLGKCGYVNAQ